MGEEGRGGKEENRAFPQLQICHYTTARRASPLASRRTTK